MIIPFLLILLTTVPKKRANITGNKENKENKKRTFQKSNFFPIIPKNPLIYFKIRVKYKKGAQMSEKGIIKVYLKNILEIHKRGDVREESYYPVLKEFIEKNKILKIF